MAELPDEVIEQIYELNVGVIGHDSERHERPHKPLLLLSIIALIDEGSIVPSRIPWSPRLREQFRRLFEVVRQRNDKNTPENPFFHLGSDGFWHAFEYNDQGGPHPLRRTPSVADARAERIYAKFTPAWVALLSRHSTRQLLRETIITRYFAKYRSQLIGGLYPDFTLEATSKVAEGESSEAEVGRKAAFRRSVLKIYDYQCAACGLRIKLPAADLTFVDAAHLIPFGESHNDHPTNGLALCKNHHWAMDRHIIAPSLDLKWEVSKSLDARRSPGERELIGLRGQRVLPPMDRAFFPDCGALEWRLSRLLP